MNILDKIKDFTNPERNREGAAVNRPLIGGVDFEDLRNQRVQIYDTLTLDLSTVRSNESLAFVGTYIYAIEATDTDANVQIRFNESFRKPITLRKNRGLRIPFYQLFFSNAAQAGKEITLVVGSESDRFEVFDGGAPIWETGLSAGFTFGDMYKSLIQGTWIYYQHTDHVFNFVWFNNSNNQNDEIEYEVYAEKGTKTFEILASKGTTYAEMSIYLSGVYQGKIDLYKAIPWARNQRLSIPVTVLQTGKHNIKLKTATRNPLSAGWSIGYQWLRIF